MRDATGLRLPVKRGISVALDDPFPTEGRDLDGVVEAFLYHDTFWL